MQLFIRKNDWEHDPLADGDSCNQVSCRADLESEPEEAQAFGALDGKVTNSTLIREGIVMAVSGECGCWATRVPLRVV